MNLTKLSERADIYRIDRGNGYEYGELVTIEKKSGAVTVRLPTGKAVTVPAAKALSVGFRKERK